MIRGLTPLLFCLASCVHNDAHSEPASLPAPPRRTVTLAAVYEPDLAWLVAVDGTPFSGPVVVDVSAPGGDHPLAIEPLPPRHVRIDAQNGAMLLDDATRDLLAPYPDVALRLGALPPVVAPAGLVASLRCAAALDRASNVPSCTRPLPAPLDDAACDHLVRAAHQRAVAHATATWQRTCFTEPSTRWLDELRAIDDKAAFRAACAALVRNSGGLAGATAQQLTQAGCAPEVAAASKRP